MNYGRQSFYFLLLMYLGFLAFLTSYILTSPNPVTHPQFYNCSKFFENQTVRPIINETIPDETYENINDISRNLVLYFFCVAFLLRALLEGSILILIKVFIGRERGVYSLIINVQAFLHLDLVTFDIPWSILLDLVVYSMAFSSVFDNDYSILKTGVETDNLREVAIVFCYSFQIPVL